MSTQIDIIFSTEGYRDDRSWFEPGSYMNGRLRILPDRELNCRRVQVGLTWHTEGIAWSKQKRWKRIDVFKGKLSAHAPAMIDFQLMLPTEPWSYEGSLVSIVWEVEVVVEAWGAGRLKSGRKFRLRPFGELLEAESIAK